MSFSHAKPADWFARNRRPAIYIHGGLSIDAAECCALTHGMQSVEAEENSSAKLNICSIRYALGMEILFNVTVEQLWRVVSKA